MRLSPLPPPPRLLFLTRHLIEMDAAAAGVPVAICFEHSRTRLDIIPDATSVQVVAIPTLNNPPICPLFSVRNLASQFSGLLTGRPSGERG